MSQTNQESSTGGSGSSGTTNDKDIAQIQINQIALHNETEELRRIIQDIERQLSRYQTKLVKLASPEKFDGTRDKLRASMRRYPFTWTRISTS
jgi:hypothetical protein